MGAAIASVNTCDSCDETSVSTSAFGSDDSENPSKKYNAWMDSNQLLHNDGALIHGTVKTLIVYNHSAFKPDMPQNCVVGNTRHNGTPVSYMDFPVIVFVAFIPLALTPSSSLAFSI